MNEKKKDAEREGKRRIEDADGEYMRMSHQLKNEQVLAHIRSI